MSLACLFALLVLFVRLATVEFTRLMKVVEQVENAMDSGLVVR